MATLTPAKRLYGHDAQQAHFLRSWQSGRLHHGWLLSGPKGVGKASFATLAAMHVFSRTPEYPASMFDPDPDHRQCAMITANGHPDCLTIRREPRDDKERRKQEDGKDFALARNIRIAQIRQLQQKFTTRPSLGEMRVIIIDSADNLERNAANALLKSLEEPPANTVFFLIAHNPGLLLPTIRSRCLPLRFDPLDHEAMQALLPQLQPGLEGEELALLCEAGQGSPGQALRYAGLDMGRMIQAMRKIVETGDHNGQLRSLMTNMVSGKANKERFEALLDFAPRYAASVIRKTPDISRLGQGIEARQEMIRLAADALILNLDPQNTAFQIGGLMAQLSATRR